MILCHFKIVVTNTTPPFLGTMKATGSKKGDGKLDLGDFLGRSKEGFQPLKQDDDDEAPTLSSDSDDLEEFSVPALRA